MSLRKSVRVMKKLRTTQYVYRRFAGFQHINTKIFYIHLLNTNRRGYYFYFSYGCGGVLFCQLVNSKEYYWKVRG